MRRTGYNRLLGFGNLDHHLRRNARIELHRNLVVADGFDVLVHHDFFPVNFRSNLRGHRLRNLFGCDRAEQPPRAAALRLHFHFAGFQLRLLLKRRRPFKFLVALCGRTLRVEFVDRLRREFKVEAKVGAPQVAYRETIRQAAECEGKYIRQSGGRGQYGHVWIRFEPNEEGKGFEFVDATVGGSVPREYIKPTEEGLVDAMEKGMIAGYPVIDVKATLFDGSYHDVDSSEMAYKIAASMALKEAGKKCKPVILEPIMNVEVTAPNEYLGSVMGDVSSRRGQITDQEERGNAIIVRAMIPLSEMFGYSTDLRSRTQGRGNYSMFFEKYEPVPKSVQEKVLSGKNE